MKIYTRRGDAGETDLFGSGRVPKDHLRVEAYGAVDELNATLGLCATATGEGDLPGQSGPRSIGVVCGLCSGVGTGGPCGLGGYGRSGPRGARCR